MRALARHREAPGEGAAFGVDDGYLGGRQDVRVYAVAFSVAQFGDHLQRLDVDDRDGAVLAQRFAEVERVQAAPSCVVGESVRVWPDRDLSEQLLVRAAEDRDPGGGAVAGEQQVIGLVDQHARDFGQVGERANELAALEVDHVDAVGADVRDVHAAAGAVGVGVIESRLRAGR